ncbi:unnamed protein product [Caenorhabditis angaria]|uniref:Acyl_transf_3 domain-containing protein n=1 Tax=Caenorhabditis angaria TaxID=860376 RepID=A0A9P1IEV5_9PELO|nr:unnamed protein product [Caenorhabditis angaria]
MKRLDLQGIRGIAILAVLGFHFFPKIFPNGYLGVDQFFVLSGFLMCMLLSKSEKTEQSTLSMIQNFYIRRFRRILPLYYLIIFISLIFLYAIFPDSAIVINEKSAKQAMMFLSNRLKTDEESYFEMLSIAVDIFTHTWSLSVEIQFYLLAPLIFLIPSRIASMVYLSIGSLIYFYQLPPSFTFINVFSRIWQFLAGMMAFILCCENSMQENAYKLLEEGEDIVENCEKSDDSKNPLRFFKPCSKISMVLTVSVILVNFNVFTLPADFVRPIITFLTTAIIIFSNSENNKLLSNNILTYIGDISYSLYLIHWPIYAYWKLTQNENILMLIVAIILSIASAALVYNYFEKWYTVLSNRNVAILSAILLIGNVMILHHETINEHLEDQKNVLHNFTSLDGIIDNLTLEDAQKINYDWNINDNNNLITNLCNYTSTPPFGWCNMTGLDQNDNKKYKIMVLGNSWAANHAKILHQECGYKARIMIIGAKYGCEPLYPSDKAERCYKDIDDFKKHIEDFQPDYAFHITRFFAYGVGPFNGDFANDEIYQTMLNNVKFYTKYIKKKFYILDAIPRAKNLFNLVEFMKMNLTNLEIDDKITDLQDYETARVRYHQLVKDCGEKCELFDYVPKFYQKATKHWRFFDDRGFEYLTSANHLSFHGLELVRDVVRDVCQKCSTRLELSPPTENSRIIEERVKIDFKCEKNDYWLMLKRYSMGN